MAQGGEVEKLVDPLQSKNNLNQVLFIDLYTHTRYMFNFYNKTLKSRMSFTLYLNI